MKYGKIAHRKTTPKRYTFSEWFLFTDQNKGSMLQKRCMNHALPPLQHIFVIQDCAIE